MEHDMDVTEVFDVFMMFYEKHTRNLMLNDR